MEQLRRVGVEGHGDPKHGDERDHSPHDGELHRIVLVLLYEQAEPVKDASEEVAAERSDQRTTPQ